MAFQEVINMTKKRDPMISDEATDEAIAQFWDTHNLTDYLDELEITDDVVFVKPKKQVVSIRLEPKYVHQLKILAHKMGIGYSLLVRHWVMERLRHLPVKAQHSH
jgi:predicted DNA binding CopG/RHH family protein